jgi:hypothetical protein
MFREIVPLMLMLWMLLVLVIIQHRHTSTSSIGAAMLPMLSPLLEHAV